MRSLIDLIRQCLKSCTWWPLRACEGRPGVMGVSRARMSGASEEGLVATEEFSLAALREAMEEIRRRPELRLDPAGSWYGFQPSELLNLLLHDGQPIHEWARCISPEEFAPIPDTFPEDWTGGQP